MGKKWSPNDTVQFVNVLLYSLQLLHQHGVTHGDLYGHNVLASFNDKIDAIDTSSPSINIRLSDFGASFIYDKDEEYGKLLEAIEVRAFQVILQEVIMYYFDDTGIDQCSKRTLLLNLVKQCNVLSAFTDLYIYWQQQQLKALASAFDDTSK
jgi:serine/threonine protein kinase